MSVEKNKETFRRYVERVWREEDLDFVDEVFAGQYLSHQSDGSVLERGPEDVKKFVREYRSAFSDIEDTIEDMFGEDDRVLNRWMLSATHTGEFRGIPATGKRIAMSGMGICPLRGRQGRGELGQHGHFRHAVPARRHPSAGRGINGEMARESGGPAQVGGFVDFTFETTRRVVPKPWG